MRTKTLLMTAAIMAAGLGASVAQTVYSVNAVGYVNKSLVAGYNLVSNPLNGTNNTLETVLPVVPGDAIVLRWDSALQTFKDPVQFFDGFGWFPASVVVNPGEGFFIQMPSAAIVTFVGEVPQGTLTNKVSNNYSLISQIVPQSVGLSTVGFPATADDIYLAWNPALQTFADPIQYFDGFGFFPSDPTPAVAEAFFYQSTGGARNWVRTFSVN